MKKNKLCYHCKVGELTKTGEQILHNEYTTESFKCLNCEWDYEIIKHQKEETKTRTKKKKPKSLPVVQLPSRI